MPKKSAKSEENTFEEVEIIKPKKVNKKSDDEESAKSSNAKRNKTEERIKNEEVETTKFKKSPKETRNIEESRKVAAKKPIRNISVRKNPISSKSYNPTRGKVFYARVSKGFTPKVTFDALATNITRIIIRFTKAGIFIRVCDREDVEKSHTMWDISWPRKRFMPYRCVQELNVSLNVKHLQKLLRNVKKKDALIFYINKNDLTTLYITIQPTTPQSGGYIAQAETVHLSIQLVKDENMVIPLLPDTYEEEGEVYETYGNPMVIYATDFQKIKKMNSVCKNTITVTMQKDNYISFNVGSGNIMGSGIEFGELTSNPENEEECSSSQENSDGEEDYSVDEESSEEEIISEEDYSIDEESEEEYNEEDLFPFLYKKEFNMPLFSPLVKLPSLCAQMEFYSPTIENFPLKVSLSASSGLGDISVYVRDKEQIAAIEKLKDRNK